VSIQDKGYSFVLYESYDYKCNAVVQEYYSSQFGHARLLFDFANNSTDKRLWLMVAPNSTFPKGLCVAQKMEAEVPYENVDGKHVSTTRHFLGSRDKGMKYVDEHTTVRCGSACVCYRWSLTARRSQAAAVTVSRALDPHRRQGSHVV
jgi:hypothetical protein